MWSMEISLVLLVVSFIITLLLQKQLINPFGITRLMLLWLPVWFVFLINSIEKDIGKELFSGIAMYYIVLLPVFHNMWNKEMKERQDSWKKEMLQEKLKEIQHLTSKYPNVSTLTIQELQLHFEGDDLEKEVQKYEKINLNTMETPL